LTKIKNKYIISLRNNIKRRKNMNHQSPITNHQSSTANCAQLPYPVKVTGSTALYIAITLLASKLLTNNYLDIKTLTTLGAYGIASSLIYRNLAQSKQQSSQGPIIQGPAIVVPQQQTTSTSVAMIQTTASTSTAPVKTTPKIAPEKVLFMLPRGMPNFLKVELKAKYQDYARFVDSNDMTQQNESLAVLAKSAANNNDGMIFRFDRIDSRADEDYFQGMKLLQQAQALNSKFCPVLVFSKNNAAEYEKDFSALPYQILCICYKEILNSQIETVATMADSEKQKLFQWIDKQLMI
jgi:hypothetical protein